MSCIFMSVIFSAPTDSVNCSQIKLQVIDKYHLLAPMNECRYNFQECSSRDMSLGLGQILNVLILVASCWIPVKRRTYSGRSAKLLLQQSQRWLHDHAVHSTCYATPCITQFGPRSCDQYGLRWEFATSALRQTYDQSEHTTS